MTSSSRLITPGVLARAAATGAAGAALSADRHPGVVRGLGLAVSAGAGMWVALAAGGVIPRADPEEGPAPPAVAIALGVGIFAVAAGASEVGLRGQRRLEQWADRACGRPRLTVGLLSAGLSLAVDVAERAAADRR